MGLCHEFMIQPHLFYLFFHYQLSAFLQICLQIRDVFILYIYQHRCWAILRLHGAEGYIVHLQAIHVAGKETIGWCLLSKPWLWVILALLSIFTLGKPCHRRGTATGYYSG